MDAFINYKGTKIYRACGENEDSYKEHFFVCVTNKKPYITEPFDIRTKPGYDPNQSEAHSLVKMMDNGVFGEIASPTKQGTYKYGTEESYEMKCPVCGADDLSYEDDEVFDDRISSSYVCDYCGVSGVEWGNIVFNGFEVG